MAKEDFTPKRPRSDAAAAVRRMSAVARARKQDPSKSIRQIARELNWDEKTVRLDIEKLDRLSAADLEQILAGQPADPILKRARQRKELLPAEKQKRAIDSIVRLMFQCLSEPQQFGPNKVTLCEADQEQVLKELLFRDRYQHHVATAPVKRRSRASIVDSCRPEWNANRSPAVQAPTRSEIIGDVHRADAADVVTWFADWLGRWLPLVCRDRETLLAAVRRALAQVERERRPETRGVAQSNFTVTPTPRQRKRKPK